LRGLARRRVRVEVRPGESYRRYPTSYVAEIATVLGLRRDALGIEHVIFTLVFECSDTKRFEEGTRILALDSFLDVYRERIR
jgi:hypothetical protein